MTQSPVERGSLRQVGDGASAIASFAAALNDSSFSDVSFLCTAVDAPAAAGGAPEAAAAAAEVYHAHRAILAARSPMFRKMLLGDWAEASAREVRVDNFLARHFYSVLEWAYTGQAHIGARDVLGVLHCAAFYGFEDLQDHCRRLAVEFIDVENVLVLLDAALENGQTEIVDECVSFWEQNASEVVVEPAWTRLRLEGVEQLLAHAVVDCGEALLFDRTVAWLRRNVSSAIAAAPEAPKNVASGDAAADGDTQVATAPSALSDADRDICERLLSPIRFSQMSVHELLGDVKAVINAVAPKHFAKYVTALEYKLSPKHFDANPDVALQPRVPSILGRFARQVPAAFLAGWTRLVEVEGLLPLEPNVFASVPPSAVYVCVGQRQGDKLEFVAVGHIALALKKMPVQQLVEDEKLYWCCHNTCFGVQARDWQPQKAAYPTAGVTKGGQFGHVCQFIWPRKNIATPNAFGATGGSGEAVDEQSHDVAKGADGTPAGRFFIFYK